MEANQPSWFMLNLNDIIVNFHCWMLKASLSLLLISMCDGSTDIIEEAIYYFKANIFFKNYEIKGDADRVLIYLTLYITECLKKLQRCQSKEQGRKELQTLAVTAFDIPGDSKFPLNAMYQKPNSRQESDQMRQYMFLIPKQINHQSGGCVLQKENSWTKVSLALVNKTVLLKYGWVKHNEMKLLL
ncbi:Actin-related 2 3 complex subunit 3 [Paramuricea clavata]|uniref:Actin-related 2 3 complex subunit 3 n=1 Tax=Paramuricea clavata TaxID=317549 RepID=A0A6S7KA98_PARCT|nr:Actin-related 2 3 complex subunit 3 [Paramuricea clavata]